MLSKKVSLPYQLVIRSENRLNRAITSANDFQIYINEFLPNDTNLFQVKLIQCAISKKALPADFAAANRLMANYVEVNAYFNGSYGYDTLYQGSNRYVHFMPPMETSSYIDLYNAPCMICNKFDQNFLRIQIFGNRFDGLNVIRELLKYQDNTDILNAILTFEITPIYVE